MTLKPGSWLGTYEVLGHIGSGGMGEVYRARDNKLNREVALKVLPEQFARDPERVARFRREAQLLAQLNHPNIAAIHTVEEAGGRHFLVMELVPGETLRERIKRGPVPVEEALSIAKQIAEALEAAHEKPIIHRDLKPANVKVTPEGKVKVLDFGLAKAFAGADKPVDPADIPTGSQHGTLAGTILGTPAYMSPEQARGKETDKRTDIWSFGCVLYELLTGQWVFANQSRDRKGAGVSPPVVPGPNQPPVAYAPGSDADTVADILGAVLHKEPDWTALPPDTPPGIRTLLRRCLRKDLQQRSRDAADIRLEIDDARAASSPAAPPVVAHASAPASRRWLLLGALACLAVATITGIAVWNLRPSAPPRPVERLVSPLPDDTKLVLSNVGMFAFSPDGTRLAYVASGRGLPPQLYLRQMDALEAAPLPGTEAAASPFFSPDGQWIGFVSGGRLKKISASGGAALVLCNFPGTPTGAAWGPDDTIIFASGVSNAGLQRVSAAGGEPQPFTTLQQGESAHRWPQFLPDGNTILFTTSTGGNADDAQIVAQRFDSEERKVLVRGGTFGRYVPTGPSAGLRTGHLVYYRAGTIMAVPFDPASLEVTGSASPVVENVLGDSFSGVAQFGLSNSGSLAYLHGGPQSATQTMVWANRQGVATPLPAPPRAYRAPRVSPDGRQVAVGIGTDVWIYNIPRDTLTRLTFESNTAGTGASWSSDGKRVVFPSVRAGPINLFWKPVDGSGPEERLTTSANTQLTGSSSPDGRFRVFSEIDPKTGSDLWILPTEGDRKPRVFLQTPFQESFGQVSPDGRWIAYISNESGRPEVYVRPFPGPGGKWQISTEGGSEALWSPRGNELFYRTGAQKEKMMVVEYRTEPTFSAGRPRLLFEGNYIANGPTNAGAFYSVSPDGQRFLMTRTPDQSQAALTQIHVVLNWFEELKQRVPVP